MAVLELQNITKSFSGTGVLNGISLKAEQGEFITLLGSSGCGKTTTLRIISGLESPDSGKVIIDGTDVTALAPNKRNVNTVFQNYALFPHMTVEANIGYSLKIKGTDKGTIKEEVKKYLELVKLSEYGKRMPSELSGGQRQRVAIARSVIAKPKVLLLDEPLGALDLQLRRQMQLELKKLQKQLGITFIYITHDQEEALNMSDRIGVMQSGIFEQMGTPAQVYDNPQTAFVARFVGEANIIKGKALAVEDAVLIETPCGNFAVLKRNFNVEPEQEVLIAVRSEQIKLVKEEHNGVESTGLWGIIKEKSFSGGMLRISVDMKGEELIASRHGIDSALAPGDNVKILFSPENAILVK